MKNQVKVSTTQQYSDSQGEHIVHEGKLVFLTEQSPNWVLGELYREVGTNRIFRGNTTNRGVQKNSTFESIKPIIISEEEIEVGDKYWTRSGANNILTASEEDVEALSLNSSLNKVVGKKEVNLYFNKVLALPEHFSDKHLQAIVDGKIKDGDKILVKFKYNGLKHGYSTPLVDEWKLHLNKQNHITLFPVKQSLEEATKEFFESIAPATYDPSLDEHVFSGDEIEEAIKFGVKWAVKNNYKGG